MAGAYVMMQRGDDEGKIVGMKELKALAKEASTIPLNRLFVAFFDPTLVYKAGSETFADTGMETGSSEKDLGFAEMKQAISDLKAGGVDVYLSMGGWNFNCWPALYTRYSVGGYGDHTPSYWKINQFGGGSVDGCDESNMWCWTCEPERDPSSKSLNSFSSFPEPETETFEAARKYVESKAGGDKPEWHPEMAPGKKWTDDKTGHSLQVPGRSKYADEKRDPYEDFVLMAKDLGAAGVDLDYEEFWHADYHKTGSQPGPFELHQTVYKYSAIAKDLLDAIDKHAPNLKLSTAAGAMGAWEGNWWGGNLKGVWSKAKAWFPEILERMEVNVMTYDMSKNQEFHECPEDNTCSLHDQVEFYMQNYRDAGISAHVGYEIGTPAYPDPTQDKDHQLPLSSSELQSILSKTQSQHKGGFFWELYKPGDGQAGVTEVAQALCKKTLGEDAARCTGSIPLAPASGYKCVDNQCVPAETGGVALDSCKSLCGGSMVV